MAGWRERERIIIMAHHSADDNFPCENIPSFRIPGDVLSGQFQSLSSQRFWKTEKNRGTSMLNYVSRQRLCSNGISLSSTIFLFFLRTFRELNRLQLTS